MVYADLHLHTRFSDGTFTPEELVANAQANGLRAIALTDHDTVEGCGPTARTCAEVGLEFIAATELTVEIDEREVHLLGYFVDPQSPRLLTQLARFQEARQERIREMVRRLNERRVPLRVEDVFALANCRSPGRPHVARALVAARLCRSLDEAFERFLKKGQPAWIPKYKMGFDEALQLIHDAGGVASLAHPGLTQADDLVPALAQAGLDALECYHTKHTGAAAQRYLALAAEHKLLVTGGSDCHGLSKGRPLIGTIKLPYEHVEKLRARHLQRVVENGHRIATAPSNP
jgi:predicted metal-dependent phosphoesterase TrpH